ncbi:glycosyltransferase [Pleurocapsa sp. CCALA 161]|uniref:WecB/TagA/CpsF family glycosyltransferase n=1 Tax=Pleurocapsa sp. CCALA 161 TaxID=2107688 RepID=UPI000D04EF0C|nr:WecB/TagA/CpsF family glycosyltransferase [Pleurocapsa sp. CCALA 161]PSB06646.1 glycosyltransferase [Pleurocapsa sp. CCALA 161]
MIPKKEVIDVYLTCVPFDEQMMLILRWAKNRASKTVCLANVHMLMEARRNSWYHEVLRQADLVTPDGKPLVMMLRGLGIMEQNQVSGMNVFENLCESAEKANIPIYFLGSTPEILDKMKQRISKDYPVLKIAGMKSIPFMSVDEIRTSRDEKLIEEINDSGAGIIFVCLGCPKQEVWMSQYKGLINGVMIGVGAVFAMYAGITPRAPHIIQDVGMEWLYRLAQEPNRLWHRYSSTIPPFMYLAAKQLLNRDSVKSIFSQANLSLDIDNLDFSPEKIGKILQEQNLLSAQELDQALLLQELNPNLKLGEILVRNNSLSVSQLKFYLKNQNVKLGQLLVEKKILRENKLQELLSLQSITEQKLGSILIENKNVSREQIEDILLEQYLRRKGLFLSDLVLS